MLQELKTYGNFKLWLIYSAFLVAINYLVQSFLITNDVLYQSLGEQLSYERIDQLLVVQQKWAWLGYLILPFLYAIKFFLVACSFCKALPRLAKFKWVTVFD